jgi:hypothetical protein
MRDLEYSFDESEYNQWYEQNALRRGILSLR